MVVGLNLAIDLSYAFLDPRIRYREVLTWPPSPAPAPPVVIDVYALPPARPWYIDVWVRMLRRKPLGTMGGVIVLDDAARGRLRRRAHAVRLLPDEPARALHRRECASTGSAPISSAATCSRASCTARGSRSTSASAPSRSAASSRPRSGSSLPTGAAVSDLLLQRVRRRLDGVPAAAHLDVDHVAARSERAEHHPRARHRRGHPRVADHSRRGALHQGEHLHRERAGPRLGAHPGRRSCTSCPTCCRRSSW